MSKSVAPWPRSIKVVPGSLALELVFSALGLRSIRAMLGSPTLRLGSPMPEPMSIEVEASNPNAHTRDPIAPTRVHRGWARDFKTSARISYTNPRSIEAKACDPCACAHARVHRGQTQTPKAPTTSIEAEVKTPVLLLKSQSPGSCPLRLGSSL